MFEAERLRSLVRIGRHRHSNDRVHRDGSRRHPLHFAGMTLI